MYIPNKAIPVDTSPRYNYLQGEDREQTHFLQSCATNMGKFGKLPWSLEERYHKLIHNLIEDGIDHCHPDFPKTEKQAETILKKYSTLDNDKIHFERAIKKAVVLTKVQIKSRRANQKTIAQEFGYTIREVDNFYKAKGRGLLNLTPKELVNYMKMEGK